MNIKSLSKIILISFVLLGNSCLTPNKVKLRPIQIKENYHFNDKTSLFDRVQRVPDFALEYLQKLDSKPEYKNYILSESESEIMEEYLKLIPESYKKILNERLIGIYFIENLWGSGITQYCLDSNKEVYSIVFLNPQLLKMNLNEAFTFKEKSSFNIDDKTYDLKVNLSNKYNGIIYVLLHELTHAVDYTSRITPYTHPNMLNFVENGKSTNLVDNIWTDYTIIADEYNAEIFKDVTFYGFNNGPKINISDADLLYKELNKTPFVTAYSTLSWAEDIAELFTMTYLVTILNCAFEIEVLKNKEIIYKYKPFESKILKERITNNSIMDKF